MTLTLLRPRTTRTLPTFLGGTIPEDSCAPRCEYCSGPETD